MTTAELAAHDALTALRFPGKWTEERALKHANHLSDRHVKNGTFHAGDAGEYRETFLRTMFDY